MDNASLASIKKLTEIAEEICKHFGCKTGGGAADYRVPEGREGGMQYHAEAQPQRVDEDSDRHGQDLWCLQGWGEGATLYLRVGVGTPPTIMAVRKEKFFHQGI